MTKQKSSHINRFAVPIAVKKTKLTQIFELSVIENPEKPGRLLEVIWDNRLPLVKAFQNNHCFAVVFNERNNIAGHHYHKEKIELDQPVSGDFEFHLEDVTTKRTEIITVNSSDHLVIMIPKNVAHAVKCISDQGVLIISANGYDEPRDIFSYQVNNI